MRSRGRRGIVRAVTFQAYLDSVKAKTGLSPEDFRALAAEKGLLAPGTKAGDVVSWLKADYGLGHGHAMAVYGTLKSADQPPSDDETELAKHFTGGKSRWRKPFDELLRGAREFGPGVTAKPGKTYISLLRDGKKFAIVQTRTDHVDLGIKLKGKDSQGRVAEAGSWNTMVTHRVRIDDPAQVDQEVSDWLREAYDKA